MGSYLILFFDRQTASGHEQSFAANGVTLGSCLASISIVACPRLFTFDSHGEWGNFSARMADPMSIGHLWESNSRKSEQAVHQSK